MPVDLLFQSIAGTRGRQRSFGIDLALLREGRERVLEHHRGRDVALGRRPGDVLRDRAGQRPSRPAAHHGVDQLTLEARAYGVARAFDPFLVNSVVGFIGPEYLFDERQIIRAGLEDHFMGKLLGLPMGVDVCYTNHAAADQNSADNLLMLLAAAGCNYFMGVPCADDVMLNYQSTSYHDAAGDAAALRPAPRARVRRLARASRAGRRASTPRSRHARRGNAPAAARIGPGDRGRGATDERAATIRTRRSATTSAGFTRSAMRRSWPGG